MPILLSAALIALTPAPADHAEDLVVVPQREHYPAEALAAKIEGDVPITLLIAPDGDLRCSIRDKTVPAALQRPSCLLVVQRWSYGPNLDSSGAAKPTEVRMLVHWKVPDPARRAASSMAVRYPLRRHAG